MPVGIVWSRMALARLEEIRSYIARDKSEAAAQLATRIVAVVEALKEQPHLGRAGSELGVRELIVGGTPYIVLYRVRGEKVRITTIWHAAQRRSR